MTKHDAYFRFKWKGGYLFTRQAGDSYMRIADYPSGEPQTVRLYFRGETEPLAELEIKFLPDTQPPLPDKPRLPTPLPQKQPI